jgi:hypothetical protein
MGRYPEAPYDFECLYQHSCPYLDGRSTTSALWDSKQAVRLNGDYWRLSDMYRDEVNALHGTIKQLEKDNAQLKAQLKALHQRQFKANRKPKSDKDKNKDSNPKDTNAQDTSRPRGAPKGHPHWSRRPPGPVDQTVEVEAPCVCPHCQCDHLEPCDELHEHLQEDIILQPKTRVVNFKHQQAYCPKCRRPVFNDGPGELRNSDIGPVTKATAVYLRYGLRMTYRQVQQLFNTLFKMPFVPATALAFDRTATKKGLSLYEDLKAKIRQAQQIYADETYWRQDGKNGYVWYAGNEDLAVFHIALSRASAEAIELLGENFDGSLVTDGYAAYLATHPRYHQTCLAHLIRKAKEILEELQHLPEDQRDPRAIQFCQSIKKRFQKACEVGRLRNTGKIPQRQAEAMIKVFNKAIGRITKGAALDHDKAENLRQRIMSPERDYHRLFVFLKVPGLSPTNNHAEQTLRTPVIFRKICFGTRTDAGSLSHSVLPSLLVTSIRQGNHPLAFFQTLFTRDTATAQAAMYQDSS